ncbi:Asparagine--tRNA ligase [Seminavis robusta]|uniref:asparagine--tRNA ligase n=1 Tax=Seminavis robusta TaxID=568900 RepID=A0A9N8HIK1_9STRA|nr:Asparagine--tRNA ligase [Seminavis robusta]|eukprot:Sro791_g202920.1 Asparagine--tRNA ligase (543) ;mRNA; f:7615-9475
MLSARLARAFVLPGRIQLRPVRALAVSTVSKSLITTSTSTSSTRLFSATTSTSAPTVLPRVKTIDAKDPTEVPVIVKGWVRTIRKQKTLAFVQVNDGSNLKGIQCVVAFDDVDETTMAQLDKVTTGCAVYVEGPLVSSPSKSGEQNIEMAATKLTVVGDCPPDQYPLAKKRHTMEYLRTIAHLRPRTNTIAAVARVRSALAGAIHEYFQKAGFLYVQTPLITASDCEGAGELFRVTTLDLDNVDALPRASDNDDEENNNNSQAVDYSQDFFGKPSFLTVSGQLGGETHACALGDIYTFGPTFRAENSQTTRHLAEFNMVEPEMAFADLQVAMANAEGMVKYVVQHVLDNCQEDLQFFTKFYDKQKMASLERLVNEPFARVSYREAIGYLQEEIAKDPSKWQFPDVEFGTDLATEHERWLAETKFNTATFVYNYPKSIKAFYMRDNEEDGGETVNAMDLLVPGVGELVGGSQREERLDVLEKKLEEVGLDKEDYWWYLDLRRFGSVPHAGYGLGFERLVTYVCGIENIRDAIAFPRYPGNAEF